jgi:hypothetical protein
MSDIQGSTSESSAAESSPSPAKRHGGRIALLGAGATALAILNIAIDTEAQSMPVLILEYGALSLGLLALIGGLMMTLLQR